MPLELEPFLTTVVNICDSHVYSLMPRCSLNDCIGCVCYNLLAFISFIT